MHSVPDAKREFSPRGGARALGTLLPLPLRVYEASKALIYSCMTIALMRPTHFSPAAPYARLHVSRVRTTADVTGAARHAHIRFMRAHGRPARANSDSIRPGTRENGHRTGHAAHTLHRPAMTRDTARPLGAITAFSCRHDLRMDRQGRASMCEAKIRAFGRAVDGRRTPGLEEPAAAR